MHLRHDVARFLRWSQVATYKGFFLDSQWNNEKVDPYPPMLTVRGSREQFYIIVKAVIDDDVAFDVVSLFEYLAAPGKWAGVAIIGVGHDILTAHHGEGNRHSMVAVTMPASAGSV
jgi:hypothetical protein